MRIEEQNFFTAIELATLKPLIDEFDFYNKLMENNIDWIKIELPNMIIQDFSSIPKPRYFLLNTIGNILSSDRLNIWLMKLTDYKWRKKWGKKKYPQNDYELAFKTRVNISKNHLHNYQVKLLNHLDKFKK
jgi:hypothetical protein